MTDVTVIIPTFNEGGNVRELVARLTSAFAEHGHHLLSILFVDDSTDDTPDIIRNVARHEPHVHLLHRPPNNREGGLAGAVAAGIRQVNTDIVVVMDGDMQHPPELAPLLASAASDADLAVASRYCGEGDASGLSSNWRRTVSSSSTMLAQACFPRRVGRVCSDPMTGFFGFRREVVHLDRLQPKGFKILLEILARHDLRVTEIPFVFGERATGESKASWRNGLLFLWQMASLRMGRMGRFAAVGALGTVLNLVLMAGLIHAGVHYVVAAVLASEAAILQNFLLQERFVFPDMRDQKPSLYRWLTFFGFNNVETLVRVPVLIALVSWLSIPSVLAQAATLAFAFLARFLFVTRVVYRPSRTIPFLSRRNVEVQQAEVA